MAIGWRDSQRTRVDKSLRDHPLESGRCHDAAREILLVATELDAAARTRLLKPSEGRFVVPKARLGVRWFHHYSVNAQLHYVDALTGADGTVDAHYLQEHWQYPDALVWRDGDHS